MSPVRRLGWRVGRRGACLLLMGVSWTLYGVGLLLSEPTFAQERGLTVITHVAPLDVWAWLWIVGGALGVGLSMTRSDAAGYVGVVLPPLTWAVSYALACWPLGDYERGWISAVVWGAIAGALFIVSGIPEIEIRTGEPHGS